MRYFSKHCCAVCRLVLSTLFIVFLSACSSPYIADDINEYQQRLSRVLDTELVSPASQAGLASSLAYPTRNDLLKQPTSIGINLTQFHQLQQCELGNLVAEHNTALGKIQHFSQRLHYEQQFIAALNDCMTLANAAQSATNEWGKLTATMSQWQRIKQAEYPLHWSNMLVLSDETKAAFSRARPALLYQDTIDIAGQVSLFKQVTALAEPQYQPGQSIEASLQAISASRLPASIWLAQQHIATQLPPITAALKTQLTALDCTATTPEKANVLRNVFYLFFIDKIQPAGARINAFTYQFAPVMNTWLASPALPDSFKQYLRSQQRHFAAYQQAMDDHVTLWQGFLSRCNLSPVAPSSA
ncbi:DUF3080 family protein [Alteromonas gilva]|uniref:DUF3080 family protein n=1 Tax=Alteromonas gilva TaxID=2987522 RepID=A0ABT5L321_9ALTE|nr:DUF3080 family protein [Alteromonas gilva]MDC8831434.1 DUF3080 family protein [Alteromonas gilva]